MNIINISQSAAKGKKKRASAADEYAKSRQLQKPCDLIHTRTRQTLYQRKGLTILVAHAYSAGPEKTWHEIDSKTVCEILGLRDFNDVKDALDSLAEFRIEYESQDKKTWGLLTIISQIEIVKKGKDDGGGSVIRYRFDEVFRAYLASKADHHYAYIPEQALKEIKKLHTYIMYENCRRYIGNGSTGFRSIDRWRELLGCPDSYENKHFFTRIIRPAIVEINNTTDVEIEPKYKYRGKSISAIKMLVRSKNVIPISSKSTRSNPKHTDSSATPQQQLLPLVAEPEPDPLERFRSLPEGERQGILEAFLAQAGGIVLEGYRQGGVEHPYVAGNLGAFLRQRPLF